MSDDDYFLIVREGERELAESVRVAILSVQGWPVGSMVLDTEVGACIQVMSKRRTNNRHGREKKSLDSQVKRCNE